MGVITPDGVVGKVIESYSDTAQVLLLTDKDSGVGAMLVESRIQSPVGGTGEPLLIMKYIPNDDNCKFRRARGYQRHGPHLSARLARRHHCGNQTWAARSSKFAFGQPRISNDLKKSSSC